MTRIVNKDQYYDTALEVLAQDGFKGLRIGVLCKRFGVTTGSFYHHFGSWQGFVDALLEYWENRQVLVLREMKFGAGGPVEDLNVLMQTTLGLNHAAEAAIRAWSANDSRVLAAQKRVDEGRLKTTFGVVNSIVGDRDVAKVLTAVGAAIVVGYQQRWADDDPVGMSDLLSEYVRLVFSHSSVESAAL